MKCPDCGYNMSDGFTHCDRCDAKLSPQVVNLDEPVPVPKPKYKLPSNLPPLDSDVPSPDLPPAQAPAQADISEQWYYVKGKREYGPFTQRDMVQLIHEGTVGRYTQIWCQGMTDWFPASVTKFSAVFAQDSNPPPPPLVSLDNNDRWVEPNELWRLPGGCCGLVVGAALLFIFGIIIFLFIASLF